MLSRGIIVNCELPSTNENFPKTEYPTRSIKLNNVSITLFLSFSRLKVGNFLPFIFFQTIYVTSFLGISYLSNNEYWSQTSIQSRTESCANIAWNISQGAVD